MKKVCTRGFTLVELLVVIGIIAVLISLLLPTLKSVRESARGTVCLANIRQINNSILLYANDNNQAAVPAWWERAKPARDWGGPPGYPSFHDAFAVDHALLGKYANNDSRRNHDEFGSITSFDQVWYCPSDQYRTSDSNTDIFYVNPSSSQMYHRRMPSYGLTEIGWPDYRSREDVRYNEHWRLSAVKSPAKLVTGLDTWGRNWHPGYTNSPPMYGNPFPVIPSSSGYWNYGRPDAARNHANRHGGGGSDNENDPNYRVDHPDGSQNGGSTNVGFLDGSARNIPNMKTAHVAGEFHLRPDGSY